MERTWGSEPSQYPEEEKTTVIPIVVASEFGTAQTERFERRARGCRTTITLSRAPLGRPGGEGERVANRDRKALVEWSGKASHRG